MVLLLINGFSLPRVDFMLLLTALKGEAPEAKTGSSAPLRPPLLLSPHPNPNFAHSSHCFTAKDAGTSGR